MSRLFEDHLGVDAVVAYVDGELGLTAFQRAAAHVAACPACAADVAEQACAQQWLRAAPGPAMPGSLFDALRAIPLAAPLPGPPTAPDPVIPPPPLSRRARLGTGALIAGIAVGALMTAATPDRPASPAGPTVVRGVPAGPGATVAVRSARWAVGR